MDSLGNIVIKPDIGESPSNHGDDTVISNPDANLVIVQQKPGLVVISQANSADDNNLKALVEDTDNPIIIRDEKIGHLNTAQNVRITSTNSPDQLSDLQSYLVTFNKEIGHGGQATPFSIGELDPSSITSNARSIVFSDGQILNVSSGFHANQDIQNLNDDTKVEIAMTTDNLDPQTQTLRIAEALSDTGALLQQNNQVINQDELSPLGGDQQRTVMLQGLPGAQGTLVQVNVPGTPRSKVVPVVSLDGKEQLQLNLDSVSTVIPQIIQGSESSEALVTLPTAVETVKGNVAATPVSSGFETLHGIQLGQADITNAQLVSLQSSDSSQLNALLVSGNNSQELQMLANNDTESSNANFQTVSIVPQSGEGGSDMNYVLIVSQPDGDKDGGSAKQFAVDMGMLQLDGREVMEEVVDQDGNTRKIIRVHTKKIEVLPSALTTLQCHYCDYTATKRYLMMRHIKTHSEDRPYQCNLCEKSFKTHASLQNHVNTHTGVRPHKCKDCEMAFTTSGELVRHIRYKHTFEKPHKCTECDYASVELSKLKRHMRSHTGERPYHCPHCHYASPDTYKLKRHLRIHTGEKPYECDVCHARFTQSNSLKAHKLIHSGMKPVFQCELCPTTCGRKTDLKIHMMKLHSNDKPVDCKKCGMVFNDRYSFKLHLKTHDGEKCFKCDQCDYAALSQRHLESHLLTHTGEKPFECDECEQTFRQKQLLKRHKNLYHTPDYSKPEPKEKNFDCTLCNKQFANKGNFLRHMQNHDPEYWNKKLSEGENSTISTDDLIQGSLLNDMRDGKLGAAPKVVIVHPNGSVEEVTSRLQTLVAEKQMEEMMVQVVHDENNQSLEDAIRSQVETALRAQELSVLENSKTVSVEETAAEGLTIDLCRPTQADLTQPKQTYSRQELEDTGSLGQWNRESVSKMSDQVVKSNDDTEDTKTESSTPELSDASLVEAMETD